MIIKTPSKIIKFLASLLLVFQAAAFADDPDGWSTVDPEKIRGGGDPAEKAPGAAPPPKIDPRDSELFESDDADYSDMIPEESDSRYMGTSGADRR
jgi:hypothetical protein